MRSSTFMRSSNGTGRTEQGTEHGLHYTRDLEQVPRRGYPIVGHRAGSKWKGEKNRCTGYTQVYILSNCHFDIALARKAGHQLTRSQASPYPKRGGRTDCSVQLRSVVADDNPSLDEHRRTWFVPWRNRNRGVSLLLRARGSNY